MSGRPSTPTGLGFGGQRLQFELSQFIPLAIFVLIGVAFYFAGARTRAHMVRVRMAEHGEELEDLAPVAPATA